MPTVGYRVVEWVGTYVPCCHDYELKNAFGNAHRETWERAVTRLKTKDCSFCGTCELRPQFDAWRKAL